MLFIRKAGKRIMPIQRKKGCDIVPKEKWSFEDFIRCVETGSQEFVRKMHSILSEGGCKIEVKEAKSGYVVSYRFGKKTLINYVFRKKGLLVRIYAEHIREYMDLLDTLPAAMEKAVHTAPVCKRLVNPDSCNPKCAMGYDFLLKGEHMQKCLYSAFQFFICEEHNPFIQTFLEKELAACQSAA